MCNIIPKICARLKMSPDSEVEVSKIKNELNQYYTINTTEDTVAEILQEIKRRKLS